MIQNDCFSICFKSLAQLIPAQAAMKLVAFRLLMTALNCLLIYAVTPPALAAAQATYAGVVTRVIDGDTVWVATSAFSKPLKVRLQGLDAPEICQAGGKQARDALVRRLLGQQVTLTSRAHDDYGRTVGTIYLQGQDTNRWLVANGHAWVYSFRHKKAAYADEFERAQVARLG